MKVVCVGHGGAWGSEGGVVGKGRGVENWGEERRKKMEPDP